MIPQYQFNLGQIDPLLSNINSPQSYINNIEQELQRLNLTKQKLLEINNNNANNTNLWDEIDKEITSMTNEQKQILAKDEEYNSIDRELQILVQQELINSVKDKIANSQRGKELLEKQLHNLKKKKQQIEEEANKEIELFKKFQQAVQINPELTYKDFIQSINK